MALNLIAIKKLRLSEVRGPSQASIQVAFRMVASSGDVVWDHKRQSDQMLHTEPDIASNLFILSRVK